MAWSDSKQPQAGGSPGWEAAMLEFEHQAEHWDTPDHGDTGHLIASALRAAVDIARMGGLACEHQSGRFRVDTASAMATSASDETPTSQRGENRRRRDAA